MCVKVGMMKEGDLDDTRRPTDAKDTLDAIIEILN